MAICHGLLWWVLIPGLIGARLYHVLDYWGYYSKNLNEIFFIWHGGLGILGAIIGGVLGLLAFAHITYHIPHIKKGCKKRKISFKDFLFSLLDTVVIGLPAGQAIGRLGNFFNQELYGFPTNLPWGIYIRPENRATGYESFERFHPLFAYEMAWSIITFIIIIAFIKAIKRQKKGELFFVYLGFYGLGRFFLEFLRIENWIMTLPFAKWHLSVAQVISIIFIIASLAFFTRRFYVRVKV